MNRKFKFAPAKYAQAKTEKDQIKDVEDKEQKSKPLTTVPGCSATEQLATGIGASPKLETHPKKKSTSSTFGRCKEPDLEHGWMYLSAPEGGIIDGARYDTRFVVNYPGCTTCMDTLESEHRDLISKITRSGQITKMESLSTLIQGRYARVGYKSCIGICSTHWVEIEQKRSKYEPMVGYIIGGEDVQYPIIPDAVKALKFNPLEIVNVVDRYVIVNVIPLDGYGLDRAIEVVNNGFTGIFERVRFVYAHNTMLRSQHTVLEKILDHFGNFEIGSGVMEQIAVIDPADEPVDEEAQPESKDEAIIEPIITMADPKKSPPIDDWAEEVERVEYEEQVKQSSEDLVIVDDEKESEFVRVFNVKRSARAILFKVFGYRSNLLALSDVIEVSFRYLLKQYPQALQGVRTIVEYQTPNAPEGSFQCGSLVSWIERKRVTLSDIGYIFFQAVSAADEFEGIDVGIEVTDDARVRLVLN